MLSEGPCYQSRLKMWHIFTCANNVFLKVSLIYKVVQIWPGQTVTCLHTNSPGHIWTTLYLLDGRLKATFWNVITWILKHCTFSCTSNLDFLIKKPTLFTLVSWRSLIVYNLHLAAKCFGSQRTSNMSLLRLFCISLSCLEGAGHHFSFHCVKNRLTFFNNLQSIDV